MNVKEQAPEGETDPNAPRPVKGYLGVAADRVNDVAELGQIDFSPLCR